MFVLFLFLWVSVCPLQSEGHTHTSSFTSPLPLLLFLLFTLLYPFSLPLSISHFCPVTSRSLRGPLTTHPHSYAVYYNNQKHTLSFSLSFSLTPSLSLHLFVSLIHINTLSFPLSLSHTHTHTHAFLYDKVAVSISPVKKMYLIVSYIDGPDAANPLMSLEPNRVVTYCVMEMARHCRYMVMIRHGYLLECQTCAIASSVSLHPVITWQLGRVCCHRNSSVSELKKTKWGDVSGLQHSHD